MNWCLKGFGALNIPSLIDSPTKKGPKCAKFGDPIRSYIGFNDTIYNIYIYIRPGAPPVRVGPSGAAWEVRWMWQALLHWSCSRVLNPSSKVRWPSWPLEKHAVTSNFSKSKLLKNIKCNRFGKARHNHVWCAKQMNLLEREEASVEREEERRRVNRTLFADKNSSWVLFFHRQVCNFKFKWDTKCQNNLVINVVLQVWHETKKKCLF